jgi:metal-dependent HD superfamily phosphatase/phosphodiesterase
MDLKVPAEKNDNLRAVIDRVNAHAELAQIYECVNVMAVERLNITDHGPIHIKIVCNIALRLLRLLKKADVQMSVEKNYGLGYAEAEVIVLLGALLHDIGMVVHREHHEEFSAALASRLIDDLLGDTYALRERVILRSEILHTIYAHNGPTKCLTVEAGVVKVADALDMKEGRSRIVFELGDTSIHSISSLAIEDVQILEGKTKPLLIEIKMSNSAGIFQIDELLKRKVQNSSLRDMIEIVANIDGENEKKLLSFYEF